MSSISMLGGVSGGVMERAGERATLVTTRGSGGPFAVLAPRAALIATSCDEAGAACTFSGPPLVNDKLIVGERVASTSTCEHVKAIAKTGNVVIGSPSSSRRPGFGWDVVGAAGTAGAAADEAAGAAATAGATSTPFASGSASARRRKQRKFKLLHASSVSMSSRGADDPLRLQSFVPNTECRELEYMADNVNIEVDLGLVPEHDCAVLVSMLGELVRHLRVKVYELSSADLDTHHLVESSPSTPIFGSVVHESELDDENDGGFLLNGPVTICHQVEMSACDLHEEYVGAELLGLCFEERDSCLNHIDKFLAGRLMGSATAGFLCEFPRLQSCLVGVKHNSVLLEAAMHCLVLLRQLRFVAGMNEHDFGEWLKVTVGENVIEDDLDGWV